MNEYSNQSLRDRRRERRNNRHNMGNHVWLGVFLLIFGVFSLIKANFDIHFPRWIFTWEWILIGIGLFIGFKENFKGSAWIILIAIGSIFLSKDVLRAYNLQFSVWPIIMILVGVYFITQAGGKKKRQSLKEEDERQTEWGDIPLSDGTPYVETEDDYVDSTSIFGSDKKNVLSKNFRGGEITNVFGGSEVDLTQADIQGKCVLEVTAIFGGATLIIPSNWLIRSEAVTIFGGISDKRKMAIASELPRKTLIIKGTVLFGGIEIKSY
ncbi:hypothetical protein ACFS6H_09220 [Terrimonas rubra]|uniref:LiaF transmembrane domain-containing protein n=1 Tax=Terrimonas rubra TaxID=1035890 RepID=A0ABW6A5X6_9BACT